MLAIAPVFLLILSSVLVYVLNAAKARPGYPWLIALVGSAFCVIYLIVGRWVPFPGLNILTWNAIPGVDALIAFQIDAISWPLTMALTVTLLSALLVSPAWMGGSAIEFNPGNIVLLFAFATLTTLAATPLAFIIAITILDLVESAILIREETDLEGRVRILLNLFFKWLSSAMILVASVSTPAGEPFILSAASSKATDLIFIAAAIRALAMPALLRFQRLWARRPILVIGSLLASQTAGLALLLRTPSSSQSALWGLQPIPLLIILLLLMTVFWTFERRPSVKLRTWMLVFTLLVLMAHRWDASDAKIALVLIMLLPGAAITLYIHRAAYLLLLLSFSVFALSGLPFSAAAVALTDLTQTGFPVVLIGFLWLVLLPSYVQDLLRDRPLLPDTERWLTSMYYLGHAVLALAGVLLVRSIDNASNPLMPVWWVIPGILATFTLVILRIVKPDLLVRRTQEQGSWLRDKGQRVAKFIQPDALISMALRAGARVFVWVSNAISSFERNLEGNAGFIWSLLFMLLVMSLVRGVVMRP